MRHIFSLIKKELKSYFNSPIAYIFIVVFLVISSWLFFKNFFLIGQASMTNYFSLLPLLFLFLIPAVTMRLWADEKRMGTIEIALTLPVKDYELVIGKFLASFIFLIINLLLSLIIPCIVAYLGEPDLGVIIASYLGTLFMGGAYLAIGLYLSSKTENQIIAFIISIALCFIILIIGDPFVIYSAPSFIAPLLEYLGLGTHFGSIARGVIDSRDIIYYLSLTGIFLYLNVKSIEDSRRG